MVRYHLSDDGNSRECSAEPGNCPNEGKFPHFPSKEIARAAYESRNYTFGNTIKKLPKVPPGTANPILNEAKIIYKMNQWGEAPHTEKDGGKFIFLNIRGVNVSAVKIYDNVVEHQVPVTEKAVASCQDGRVVASTGRVWALIHERHLPRLT